MDAQQLPSRRWWPVAAVFLIALAVRAGVLVQSEVAARDSVGFITTALKFENEPFAQALRTSEHPPGYPLAVLIASRLVRAVNGGLTPENMTLAAQLVSVVFGALLVFPMIGFGDEILDRRFGLTAAALFQCLPDWVRLTSDGLSEAMFLFFVMSALWSAARAFRTGSATGFLVAGLASACAYLTRPEGGELVVAISLVLAGLAVLRHVAWPRVTASGLALACGFLLLAGPFVATTGRITNKPTGRFLLGDPTAEKSFFGQAAPVPVVLGAWWQDSGNENRNRIAWAVETLVLEVATTSRQVGFALSVYGLCLWGRRIRNFPGGAVLIVLSILHSLLLVRMTSAVGYLSERHTAMLVLTGVFPATLAFLDLADRLSRVDRVAPLRRFVTGGLIAAAMLTAVPSLLKPLHGNRAGHKAAGQWLARNAPADAAIRDPFCWSSYYSGRVFRETADPDPDVQYVVIETSENQHSRLPLMPEARAKAAVGELVYHWPPTRPVEKARVAVYRWVRPSVGSTATRPSPPAGGGE